MKKVLISFAVVLLLGALVLVAIGRNRFQDHQGEPEGHGGPRALVAQAIQDLALTSDQIAQIKVIIKGEHDNPEVHGLFKALKNDDKAIHDAVLTGGSTDAATASLSKDISSLIAEGLAVKAKVFAVLNPDQQAKANTMIASFAAHLGPALRFGVAEIAARHGGFEGHHLLMMADQLGLTDDQKAQIKTILTNAHSSPEAQALIGSLKSDAEALLNVVAQNQDASAAGANLARDLSSADVVRVKTFAAVNAVLTPEQQEKLKSMKGAGHRMGHPHGDS